MLKRIWKQTKYVIATLSGGDLLLPFDHCTKAEKSDRETEGNRWYASIKFYGNEKDYPYNADMCQFLASLNESRESYESYFTPKEMFDIWKKQKVSDYSPFPVTRKTYQELDTVTRLKLRNEYLEKQFQEKKSDSKKN